MTRVPKPCLGLHLGPASRHSTARLAEGIGAKDGRRGGGGRAQPAEEVVGAEPRRRGGGGQPGHSATTAGCGVEERRRSTQARRGRALRGGEEEVGSGTAAAAAGRAQWQGGRAWGGRQSGFGTRAWPLALMCGHCSRPARHDPRYWRAVPGLTRPD